MRRETDNSSRVLVRSELKMVTKRRKKNNVKVDPQTRNTDNEYQEGCNKRGCLKVAPKLQILEYFYHLYVLRRKARFTYLLPLNHLVYV